MPTTGNTKSLPPRPIRTFVRLADPDWQREKRKTVEYKFSNGRVFTGNPEKRGVYTPE